jgi:hypothetical protein
MKKIINGKLYNTETAREVARWSDGMSWRDFSHVEEVLYQKRTGEFFIHGQGGPASRYAERAATGGWDSGDKVIPLTWEEAREWAEEHLDADEYQEIFGEVAEDDSRVTQVLSLSTSAVETAKRAAAQAGVSLSAYIEGLISGQ